jgi:hypothetical protein
LISSKGEAVVSSDGMPICIGALWKSCKRKVQHKGRGGMKLGTPACSRRSTQLLAFVEVSCRVRLRELQTQANSSTRGPERLQVRVEQRWHAHLHRRVVEVLQVQSSTQRKRRNTKGEAR